MIFDLFVAPLLAFEFMRYAVATAAIVGVVSAVLSCFLVVRRSAMLGDAVSHGVLPGVAIGWLLGRHVGIMWGALVAGILVALAISFVERRAAIHSDTAMGVVFSTAFALGLAIISVYRPSGIHLTHVLLGNVLAAGAAELWLAAAGGGAVLVVVAVTFRALHAWSFDPDAARAMGLPTGFLHYLFTVLLAATIVASLQTVGLVLVVALLVTPGATASLLVRRFGPMVVVAAGLGLTSAVAGMYASYHADLPSGPAIVLIAGALFVLALLAAPRRGLVPRAVTAIRHGGGGTGPGSTASASPDTASHGSVSPGSVSRGSVSPDRTGRVPAGPSRGR